MSLRRKLIYLHSALAVFAVVAASATIYGVQLHVRRAISSLESLIDQSNLVDRLRVATQMQLVELHEIVGGRRPLTDAYRARQDSFFRRLDEAAQFAEVSATESDWLIVRNLGETFRREAEYCLILVEAGNADEAREHLVKRVERDLTEALGTRLRAIKRAYDGARRKSVNQVLARNTQLLGVAVLVALTCAAVVVAGAALVRRWLLGPIRDLQKATHEFADGNLDYRVRLRAHDELGALGTALNAMASSLSASQRKYRSLFENLRDAVIICDAAGTVIECRDSDTELLGVAPIETIDRRLLDVWPAWRTAAWDFTAVAARVASTGRQVRAVDVEIPTTSGNRAIVDVVTYPVQYASAQYAAIVLRDVTERHRLQRMVNRSETMQAALNFARGIAHDFKNLLHSAVTTLSLVEPRAEAAGYGEGIQTALSACRQAARLSRRLLSFAGSDEGRPEVLDLDEVVDLILGSLDEPFLMPLDVRRIHHDPVSVRMDRDHLTQVILNLIRNAREAMPDGGELGLETGTTVTADPIGHAAPAPHAVLTVSDTGCGMTEEVKERLFEPLFSTKPRGHEGVRGMGLAVVYTAVRSAGGFIQVDSKIGIGTTFRVFVPSGSAAPVTAELGNDRDTERPSVLPQSELDIP